MARDFKIELDNVEMINGSDDLLKDTKVTKVTLTGENKLNSLNSTFENCTELTAIEGDVNLDGVSDMTEMTLNTPLDELKVTNPTEENIQTDNSLNQVTNVKIGGTKYAKGGIQDVVGSLEWTAENFTYEDTILDNVYTNSSSIEESKNITVSDTLEQKATSIEITGQTYENLVNGKATENLLDEMSMQQTEGKPTQFTPHMEQPICLEYIEGQTYQNLVEGKGEETLISEYSPVINDFVPNTFKPPQNQPICLEYIEGETYQNLIEGKGEYKLTDTFSATWTESNNCIENAPNMIEIPEIFGNTVQGYANLITNQQLADSLNSVTWVNAFAGKNPLIVVDSRGFKFNDYDGSGDDVILQDIANSPDAEPIKLKANTTYSLAIKESAHDLFKVFSRTSRLGTQVFTTDSTGEVFITGMGLHNGFSNIVLIEGNDSQLIFKASYFDLNYIKSVGDLYVNGRGEPILDEEGNEQYKLEIISSGKNICPVNTIEPETWSGSIYNHKVCNLNLKSNTTYTISCKEATESLRLKVYNGKTVLAEIWGGYNGSTKVGTFTTGNVTNTWLMCYDFGLVDVVEEIMIEEGSVKTEYEPYKEDKTTILMPCQLSRIKGSSTYDITDKLLFNKDKGTYIIEKNINTYTTPTINYTGTLDIYLNLPRDMVSSDNDINNYPFIIEGAKVQSWSMGNLTEFAIKRYDNDTMVRLATSSSFTNEEISTFLSNKKVYYVTNSPQTIETKILEKPSLETYSPKTYISTNTEIQPSQMTITNKEVKFIPLSLRPSKSYTIQLDSVGKDNKPITVNLGGTETTIQPTNNTSKHHRVSITTPSELTTDNLDLSGEGVVVNDVMLFEGNTSVIKQDVDYTDGIQSIGELFESRNLFDYTQSEVGLLDHSNGKISEDNSWKYTTDFIPVKPNTTYCISQTSGSVFNYKIVEYNSSKTYLKGTNWTSSKGTDINRAYNTFTTSANTYHLRLGWQSSIFEIQLEADTFPTEFMAYDTVRYKLEIQTYDSTWDSI